MLSHFKIPKITLHIYFNKSCSVTCFLYSAINHEHLSMLKIKLSTYLSIQILFFATAALYSIVCIYYILLIFLKFIYLFIYLWLCCIFFAAHGLSLVAVSGGYSALWCMGFSLQWLLLLQSTGSRRAGFSSCGTRAQ